MELVRKDILSMGLFGKLNQLYPGDPAVTHASADGVGLPIVSRSLFGTATLWRRRARTLSTERRSPPLRAHRERCRDRA